MDREVVALSGSRRTESLWIRTRVFQPGGAEVLATMLLNAAYMKDSFPNYEAESKAATGT
jgi:DNA-binding protein YbaB